MNIKTLIESLENKLIALDAKKKASIEKGKIELFEVFDKEYIETNYTLRTVKMAVDEINIYRSSEVKERFKEYFFEILPSLAFYFKQESIKKVIEDSLEEALNKLIEEDFINKMVKIVEKNLEVE